MMDTSPDTLSAPTVTAIEEHFWLLQEQHPERVLKQLYAWQLDPATDPARLADAIVQLVIRVPDLNARFAFSDDGDLAKAWAHDPQACVQSLHCATPDEAIECLRARQYAPWDSATQPPFEALIVAAAGHWLLGLVIHPVLGDTGDAQGLYAQIDALCDGPGDGLRKGLRGEPLALPNTPADTAAARETANDSARDSPAVANAAHDSPAQAPRLNPSEVATLILDAFRSALAEPNMGAEDDFFEYGGHSLLATRILGTLLDRHGLAVSFSDFFSAPSAQALAHRARVVQPAPERDLPDTEPLRAPFALAQASLGRAYQAFDFGTIFNLPFALRFIDPVDEDLFHQAFSDLVQRHASLRTTYHFVDGQAWQQQVPAAQLSGYKWFWRRHESRGVRLADEAAWRFDLSRELPIRVRFLEDPVSQQQTLSLLVHHMAIDEWSLNVMMQELAIAYRARAADRAPQWCRPAPAFHAFAQRQQASGVDPKHLAYWTDHLRDATRGLRLPGAEHLPAQAPSTRAQWLELTPEQSITEGLHAFARQQGTSLFGVVYTAIALALHKLGDLADLVIGTSASGRTDAAFHDTVGYFTTMVAHRVQFDPRASVGHLIGQVTATINDSMPYADVPLEQIQHALGMTAADGLLFDVYVQIHADNALNGALAGADGRPIRYRQIDPDKNETMFGLQFEIMDNLIDGQRVFRLVITHRCERYPREQVERLGLAINQVLALFAGQQSAGVRLQGVSV